MSSRRHLDELSQQFGNVSFNNSKGFVGAVGIDNASVTVQSLTASIFSGMENPVHNVIRALDIDNNDYEGDREDIPDMATNTGKWFFEDLNFLRWMEFDSSSLLIVTGQSGQGKSVMARHLIKHLPRGSSVSYFFFNRRREEAQSPVCAVAALLHRWFTREPALSHHYAVKAFNHHKTLHKFNLLWGILEQTMLSPKSGTLYCVLDGLEKCRQSNETEAGLRNLMEAISKFFRTENHEVHRVTHLKILVTAQASETISRKIPRCDHCNPVMRLDCTEADVASMITRDVEEVIKNALVKITTSPLSRIDAKFVQSLQAGDESVWSELQNELGEYGLQADMISTDQRRSLITNLITAMVGYDINNDSEDKRESEPEPLNSDGAEAEAEVTEGSGASGPNVATTGTKKQVEPIKPMRRPSIVSNTQEGWEKAARTEQGPRRTPTFRLRDLQDAEEQRRSAVGERADRWLDYYESGFLQPLQRFLDTVKYAADDLDVRPVKLAIFSTGVNKHLLREISHRDLRDKVKVRSFVHDDPEAYDNIGIGTMVTRLLLGLAPSAEIHVFKVTSEGVIQASQVEQIVKAVNYAVVETEADILCMGFGFHQRDSEVERVIRHAATRNSGRGVIMFAAAGNEGGNRPVPYPARDPNVFCVYSTDGLGNSSAFNPSLLDPRDRFSTLGEEVRFGRITEDTMGTGSGSTLSATIAAAMAAEILNWWRRCHEARVFHRLESSANRIDYIGMEEMRKIFHLMSVERDGFRYLTPWVLFGAGDISQVASKVVYALESGW
ncbi:uncharacterized protein FMAN_08418 [Fusarium mangiferae]|uniref:Peptidase S8/S53 domain-containing protein n=1 Tax=Fusarium mangiferae TaxID=192010 RepID=A0A1L7TUA6_FUSMA|nr:uncharacterized protein FMAN_08418 [Fusarium mangiferae]CVK98821.1 uncharacterized protein FMAN_08418 [Fusarium mangiferae]